MVGLMLGFAAGMSPGPLQALVLSQSARFGWRAGAVTALAPLLSDVVIVVVTVGILGRVPPLVLHGISILGGCLVAYLAWDTYQASRKVASETTLAATTANVVGLANDARPIPRESTQMTSLRRATLINLLNPHAWLFWAIVGAPLTLQASHHRIVDGIGFVMGFYCFLIGSKVLLSILVARGVAWFGTGLQRWILWITTAGLLVVAVILFVIGVLGLFG